MGQLKSAQTCVLVGDGMSRSSKVSDQKKLLSTKLMNEVLSPVAFDAQR